MQCNMITVTIPIYRTLFYIISSLNIDFCPHLGFCFVCPCVARVWPAWSVRWCVCVCACANCVSARSNVRSKGEDGINFRQISWKLPIVAQKLALGKANRYLEKRRMSYLQNNVIGPGCIFCDGST